MINLFLFIVVKEDNFTVLGTNDELIIIKPGMISVVSILLNPLELRQLLKTTLINTPNLPMVGARGANEIPIIRIEGNLGKFSLFEVLTSQDLLFGT